MFSQKKQLVDSFGDYLRVTSVSPAEILDYLSSIGSSPLPQGRKLYDVLLRNEVSLLGLIQALDSLREFVSTNSVDLEVIEEVEILIKYNGYIQRERFIADKLHRLEDLHIPAGFDFEQLNSLTIEARQKLSRIRPATIGQASRIPGVSPADINVLLIYCGR